MLRFTWSRHYFRLSKYILIMTIGIVQAGKPYTLDALNVDRDYITMSGYSSGGTFAQQMFVSHSKCIAGIAVFSHSFYRCGFGNGVLEDYDAVCTRMGKPQDAYDPSNAVNDIYAYAGKRWIDDPYNLLHKRLYIFGGTLNYLFTPEMSLGALKVFKPFIKNTAAIQTRISPANLTLPSNFPNLPECGGPLNKYQVNNCGFSGAFDSLKFLLGNDAVRPPKGELKLQPLVKFDQSEFFPPFERHDMDTFGYAYIPTHCQDNEVKCYLHFYFHGCSSGAEFVGPGHIIRSGFLEVAEVNGIIVIFPQASSSFENKIGCWDTFGVTGKLYATQRGAQVKIVKKMLDRILSKKFASSKKTKPNPGIMFPFPDFTGNSISKILKIFKVFPKCSSLKDCFSWKKQ